MDTAVADALGTTHPLARHIGDFLTDPTNAGRPANTVGAYRGDLIAFAAYHDDEIGELTAAPIRAHLSEIAGLVGDRARAEDPARQRLARMTDRRRARPGRS